MLLGNRSVLMKSPGTYMGGSTVSDNRSNSNRSGASRGFFTASGVDAFNGIPSGYRPPYTRILSRTAGGLSSRNMIAGEGEGGSVNLAGGLNAESALAGTGALTAPISGVISAVAELPGTGAVAASLTALAEVMAVLAGSAASNLDILGVGTIESTLPGSATLAGALGAVLDAVAALTGSGLISDAAADMIISATAAILAQGAVEAGIVGAYQATATLAGDGALTGALSALAGALATLAGTGAFAATPYATGDMTASVTPFTELSPESLGAAVWRAASTNFLSTPESAGSLLALVSALLRNKQVTDPTTGILTIYDDDGVTPLLTAQLYEDADGVVTYRGRGAERREELT